MFSLVILQNIIGYSGEFLLCCVEYFVFLVAHKYFVEIFGCFRMALGAVLWLFRWIELLGFYLSL